MWFGVPGASTKICVWRFKSVRDSEKKIRFRGDICTLTVDAVVNAANEEGKLILSMFNSNCLLSSD